MSHETTAIEWLAARDALLLVQTRNGGRQSAARSIAIHAHAGRVLTRAQLFSREVRESHGRKGLVEEESTVLPQSFWWADGGLSLETDWASGYFSTWIDQTFHWKAFGVEFDRSGIETMLAPPKNAEKPADSRQSERKRGRGKGDGSMSNADAPLLDEMKQLIADGKAFSPNGAARLVWEKSAGNATEESRVTRLANRYRQAEQK